MKLSSSDIFDSGHNIKFFHKRFFCEKNVVDLLLKILKKTHSREIVNEIIQSLSMYLLNLKKPMNISILLYFKLY